MTYRKSLLSKIFGNVDYGALVLSVIAAVMGVIAVYSATLSMGTSRMFIVQTGALVIGVIAFVLFSKMDFDMLGEAAVVIYIGCVALLGVTLIFGTGLEETGTKGWIDIGFISFQPAEFVKIGFIITFAKHLQRVREDVNYIGTLAMLCLHGGLLIVMVLLQPDFGTALVFVFIFISMLYCAGFSYKYMAVLAVVAIVGISCVWIFREHIMAPHQIARIEVFFDPYKDPVGSGYNVIQSETSIGSGKLFGQGYLNGNLNQLEYLPAKHTDFIFATIGEEWGFFGCICVVAILAAIIIKCILVAKRTRNTFGYFVCVGIAAMFCFHTLENVGMCIRLMPVTGIPLPFFSYGGTSLLTNLSAMGIISSISVRSKGVNF
ncbi:MAG: rod shape-determining protein RodA [Clostridia bacterium]|nr:rod shape-determining protein RodA [Clostridia bacterium]